jgi:hypothetical protein
MLVYLICDTITILILGSFWKGTRNVSVPSHTFYANDLMVFCNGKLNNLTNLKELFIRYVMASGQIVNTSKSTFYSGAITHNRQLQIANLLNFNQGSLPFRYLGVPIFKGKTKVIHLQPVTDKIKSKLSAWKVALLSMAGRIQLVRSVIQSMLIYSISIYSWPASLIKNLEK